MAEEKLTEQDLSQFDWIQLEKDIRKDGGFVETQKEKLIRKIKEQPAVPIGVLATTAALGFGLWNFKQGNRQMGQYMMRTRVVAQGFTVVALVVGMSLGASQMSRNK